MRGIRISLAAASAALLVASWMSATGGATATPAKKAGSGCPDETLCLWAKKNYEGQKVEITKVGKVSNKLAEKMNNDAASVKNKFDQIGDLYSGRDGGGGECFGISISTNYPTLGDFNDRASSSRVLAPLRARRIC
jgi:hypothetical protein